MSRLPKSLAVLLVVFALLAAFYSIIIPIFEGPDEDDHFRYAKFIADHRALPVQSFEPGGGAAGHQGWQPPLYYSLVALVIAPIDTSDHEQQLWRNYEATFVGDPACCGRNIYYHPDSQNFPYTRTTLAVHLARLLSIAFSLITVAATFFITLSITRAAPELQITNYKLQISLAAASIVAFNPSFLFASALISNDAPLTAFSSLVLLMWTRWLTERATLNTKSAALAGLLIGLGVLTKTTALGLIPFTLLIFAYLAFRRRSMRLFVSTSTILGAVIAFVAAWMFARNQVLYGDPLALRLMTATALFPRSGELTPLELFQISLPWLWQTFWGGPTPSDFSPIILLALGALTLISLFGFVVWFLRITNYELRITILSLAAWLAFILVAQLRFITMTTGADQGRYLFPAISVIALVITLGLQEITHHASRLTHYHLPITNLLIAAFFTLALFVPFAYTRPAYARPALASANDLARITNPARVNFADQIELLGYDVDVRAVKPGDTLRVTLYWRALAPMSESYRVFVHLIGHNDRSAGGADVIPARGAFPTVYWKPGDALRDEVRVPIDANATPGKYALEVGLYPVEKNGERLTAMESGEDRAMLGAIKVAPSTQVAYTPRVRVAAPFGDAIELAGYDADTTQDEIRIVLYWRARAAIESDYKVFVHALDANDKIIAQADRQPQDGNYPTSIWSAGELISDEYVLRMPAQPSYRLALGLYRLDTGERLPVGVSDHLELTIGATR
ncbi:MAG: glycosyltransferase family 39 protein [Chloroflexi bacterium]|nr:glycosyltransferase family 39 protein [Chloroflexota bacterium]